MFFKWAGIDLEQLARMLSVWFCGPLVWAFVASDGVVAQTKVDGYDGYKFGMTIDQAKRIKSAAKQTRCEYVDVSTCLEYRTMVSVFPATVTVQFKGAAPLLSQIIITIRSLADPSHSCREVGREVLKLLTAKYGNDPFVKDHEATWASPEGGSVSLLALCIGEVEGINVITYKSSSPL
jgi:hypothetical protein